jgi:hypothetical protein
MIPLPVVKVMIRFMLKEAMIVLQRVVVMIPLPVVKVMIL